MTTIACNKFSMASDRQYSHSGGMKFLGGYKCQVVPQEFSEIFYDTPKMILGMCGDADMMSNIWEYVYDAQRAKKLPKFKGVEILALKADGTIMTSQNMSSWLLVKEPYYAIGSGMQYAIAGMASGLTPIEAVKLASKYDIYTGKGYKQFSLE